MEPRTPAEWKTLFESEAFARQTEYYGPLGVEYTPAGTHLRLWAPTAKQAAVNLYRRGTGGACVGTLPLQQQAAAEPQPEGNGAVNKQLDGQH